MLQFLRPIIHFKNLEIYVSQDFFTFTHTLTKLEKKILRFLGVASHFLRGFSRISRAFFYHTLEKISRISLDYVFMVIVVL
jgi:hypothetical protein